MTPSLEKTFSKAASLFGDEELSKEERVDMTRYIIAVVVMLLLFTGYHGAAAYSKEVRTQEIEHEQGKLCLAQYKTSDCTPVNHTDNCEKLFQCIQSASFESDELAITLEILSKTSESLWKNISGPAVMLVSLAAIFYFKSSSSRKL